MDAPKTVPTAVLKPMVSKVFPESARAICGAVIEVMSAMSKPKTGRNNLLKIPKLKSFLESLPGMSDPLDPQDPWAESPYTVCCSELRDGFKAGLKEAKLTNLSRAAPYTTDD
ncbi:MAG: hypothetical protein NDJ89_11880 [Oligoflexia bacterium]|nr:hypothetical protein [Oligoflexia bacterium]